MLYLILAVVIFGLLIAVHEFGHFITAKWFGIRVNEFSIGMGPALFQRERGETVYSLRVFPLGGFCAMEGEDGESDDPRAFERAAAWKRAIVLVAGAFMNFVTGLVLLGILYAPAQGFRQESYYGPMEGYGVENCGLEPGDVFLEVDGHPVLVYGNAQFYLNRAGETLDFVVERNGERVELNDVSLPYQERTDEEGNYTRLRGVLVGAEVEPATFGTKVGYVFRTAADYVRVVWIGLTDLLRGAVGIRDMSGPVGIVDVMTQVGESAPSVQAALSYLLNLSALLAVNLAVMNLLPIPALDGGRVLFLVLNGLLYGLTRRKIPPKYEGYVHMAGMAGLMTLMLMVTFSDIGKLFGV